MKIVLARHGDVIDPAGDSTPLTQMGTIQSQSMADGLVGFSGDIYSSPLARCRQTAKIISEKLNIPVRVEDALREVGPRETILQAQKRAMDFVDCIKHAGRDAILVTHGGIILGLGVAYGHPNGVCDRGQFIQVEA